MRGGRQLRLLQATFGGPLALDGVELEALLAAAGVDEATRARIRRALAVGASQTWSLGGDPSVSTLAPEGSVWQGGSMPAWDTEPEAPPVHEVLGPRYQLLHLLGEGGMGQVYRAWDHALERHVALKVLRPRFSQPGPAMARFLAEARATASLEHPGIVPVHGVDQLADGRPCFTMREIRGHTLRVVVRELHGLPVETPSGRSWTLRRVLDAWQRMCEAVAYAHARGVTHRDLKPDNVMIGPFGEVLVLDWGLATSGTGLEREGSISGTPRYMAPEQARGEVMAIGARTDVYALGVMLWEILEGRPAFPQRHVDDLLDAVKHVGVPALPSAPTELAELVARSTARDLHTRPADAGVLAEEMAAWLDGARRRERALALVAEAQTARRSALAFDEAAADALDAVATARSATPSHATDRSALWSAQDEVTRLGEASEAAVWRYMSLLESALTHAPELPEALAGLAAHHRQEHAQAEAAGDPVLARQHERQLRRYDRGQHATYLAGTGALTLLTDRPAEVRLHRLVEEGRRRVPRFERVLGTTPLRAVPLEMGSYVLTLHAEGCEVVTYPVHLTRQQHWDGVAPGQTHPTVLHLPSKGALRDGERYVPTGWYLAGARSGKPGTRPFGPQWVDGHVFREHPVTNREYMAFLDDLVGSGRAEDAERWVPRERGRDTSGVGPANYALQGGRHVFVPDHEGDVWLPDWPVFNVDWYGASAYAAWLAARDGLPWALPDEHAWEKAARGVDGRLFPWGDSTDGPFANTRGSLPGKVFPTPVDAFPHDSSVYGVRGMTGNVRELTGSFYDARRTGPEDERVLMGGCWFFGVLNGRLDIRYAFGPRNRTDTVGFRVARRLG